MHNIDEQLSSCCCMAWTGALLTVQLTSGMVFVTHVCVGEWWTLQQLLHQYQYLFSYVTRNATFIVKYETISSHVLCNW